MLAHRPFRTMERGALRGPILLILVALHLPAGAVRAATVISGGFITNQTWTAAGSPYVVQGDITIPPGGHLILEPGTIVQVASTDGQIAGRDTGRVEITVK